MPNTNIPVNTVISTATTTVLETVPEYAGKVIGYDSSGIPTALEVDTVIDDGTIPLSKLKTDPTKANKIVSYDINGVPTVIENDFAKSNLSNVDMTSYAKRDGSNLEEGAVGLSKMATDVSSADKVMGYDASGVPTALEYPTFSLPTGFIWFPYMGTIAPQGWLFVQGQSIDKETYADLWQFAKNSGMITTSTGASYFGYFQTDDLSSDIGTFRLPKPEDFIKIAGSGSTVGAFQDAHNSILPSHYHGAGLTNALASSPYGTYGSAQAMGQAYQNQTNYPSARTSLASSSGDVYPKNYAYPILIKC